MSEPNSDVGRLLDLLWSEGEVRELRSPKYNKYRQTASGYFDAPDKLLAAIKRWDGRANLYVTLNPVDPSLLARAANRVVEAADATTADEDVVSRRWLLVDIDPVRPTGISSTESELAAAKDVLTRLTDGLRDEGWPEPVVAMSGNGYYALYRIALPNDGESLELAQGVLRSLDDRFSTKHAKIDTTVSNAARIVGLVGTLKMKGDPLPERPHRRSRLESVPEVVEPVSVELLRALVAEEEAEGRSDTFTVSGQDYDLEAILRAHGIEFRQQPPDSVGITWYHVRRCPFHDDGRDFECGVGQKLPGGPLAGKCFHPEGEGKGWREFKHALGIVMPRDHDPAIVGKAAGGRDLKRLPTTDAGNGELFAELYGDRVRYDYRRRRWLLWGGHWWHDDVDGEVRRLAKLATRHRYVCAPGIDDLPTREKVAKFAIATENRQRLDAMLSQAQAEPPIADAGDRWDSDPWLLGVANGVVDLRTGRLRPGAQADRVTMHVDVPFAPAAECPRWLRFLDEIFRGDADLIDFVQRAAGYSLTGDTREQCLFLCYGTGSNGKSVFLSILKAVAGGYGYNTPFSTFEIEKRASIPNDVAALAGKRLVTSSETNEGTHLNEARVKALTGQDPITARFLHAEFFTFVPVGKFWLSANHRPVVTDDSHGFWRRVRLIPFTRVFTGADDDNELAERLREELPGILAWAVRGALEWQKRGLEPPDAVRAATQSYRVDSDPLAQFLEERCILGDGLRVGAAQAFKAYTSWALDQGMGERERLTSTKFGTRMSARFAKKKNRQGAMYEGVGLLEGAEASFDAATEPEKEPV